VGLRPPFGTDILELQEAVQTAQTDYLLAVAPIQADVRSRAEFVLSELTAALEWWLDDGVEDDRDRQLASLKAEYADGSASADSLAANGGYSRELQAPATPYGPVARESIEAIDDENQSPQCHTVICFICWRAGARPCARCLVTTAKTSELTSQQHRPQAVNAHEAHHRTALRLGSNGL
jgi:hypothetical protein